jgi:signal peptidase I
MQRLLKNVPQPWRSAVDWILTILGAVAVVLAIKAWVVNPYRIPSPSMEPTLHCARLAQGCEADASDRVLADRFIYHFRDPKRGEIVVFKTPQLAEQQCGSQGTFVKRVIGLPGDVWEERDGYVYIDGRKLNEPYIKAGRRGNESMTLADIPPRNTYKSIPKNQYLMMGDNRSKSCDSRRWGLVPRNNLIGKVIATYWPLNRVTRGLWYVVLALAALVVTALFLSVLRRRRTPGATSGSGD